MSDEQDRTRQLLAEAKELFRQAAEKCQASSNNEMPQEEAMRDAREATLQATKLVKEAFVLIEKTSPYR